MVHSRLVYGYIGTVIGIIISGAVDEILHQINIVVSCWKNMESLKAKVENLQVIINWVEENHLEFNVEQGTSTETSTFESVREWFDKLKKLHREADEMKNCTIPRLDVISRYYTSNKITQKHLDIDKQLKYVPLIELELLLWQLMQIQSHWQLIHSPETIHKRSGIVEVEPTSGDVECEACDEMASGSAVIKLGGVSSLGIFEAAVLNSICDKFKEMATNQILSPIKTVFRFRKELASLTDLVECINRICEEIRTIQQKSISVDIVSKAVARWLEGMSRLFEEANKIKHVPWWDVISRYKASKRIINLIAEVEAHLTLVSVIHLEPILQHRNDLDSLHQRLDRLHRDLHSSRAATTTKQAEPRNPI